MTYIAGLCCGIALLLLSGCSGYAQFINGLNERQLNSCIEGTVNVGGMFSSASGMIHVYSATGGQHVSECIRYFKNLPPVVEVQINKGAM